MDRNQLVQEIEELNEKLRSLHATEDGEIRSLTDEEQTEFDTTLKARDDKSKLLERHDKIEANAQIPSRTEGPRGPDVIKTRSAMEVFEDRDATRGQLADAVARSVEERMKDEDVLADNAIGHLRRQMAMHGKRDEAWLRQLLIRSTDVYASAWAKAVSGREFALTTEERTALGVTTNANGKFMLPTFVDPTIILTNNGTDNVMRQYGRVVTITDGSPSWNGITSDGVTASWDGELAEVSDDSPTVGQPSIPTFRAQALAQAAISAVEDIHDLPGQLLTLFHDAKDRLEGAAHMVGNGTSQPKGIFTALHGSASQITSASAAAIALADLNGLYTGLPTRWRRKASWLSNPVYTVAIKTLGTALSASFSGDLRDPSSSRILNRPVVESDDAPTTQTTTALDDELIFGDLSQYVIVDRPGDMSVEYIPHLFNTANNLPDGRRAWYATWRNGGDVTTVKAFRLLVDKTSA